MKWKTLALVFSCLTVCLLLVQQDAEASKMGKAVKYILLGAALKGHGGGGKKVIPLPLPIPIPIPITKTETMSCPASYPVYYGGGGGGYGGGGGGYGGGGGGYGGGGGGYGGGGY